MKVAVIIFHKQAYKYPPLWIEQCIRSIQKQTYGKFDVFELDYGGEHSQIYPGSTFHSTNSITNHADAHNWLLDKVFESDYDCAFNVNIDDYYSIERFEKQLKWIEAGYDVISSNFFHINEKGKIIHSLAMDAKIPAIEARRNHNIIAHPVCCYSRKFWLNCTKLNPNEIPLDDFELWKRSFKDFKFKILPNFLLYYRIHSTKVSAQGQWKSA